MLFFLLASALVASQCPHEDAALAKWSATLPTSGDVVIDNQRVLMDVTALDVGSITLQNNAELVFDAGKPAITVRASHIVVKSTAKLVAGTEACPYTNQLSFTLYGLSTSSVSGFGYRMLGVESGGAVDLHGAVVTPWLLLNASVPEDVDMWKEPSVNGRGMFLRVLNGTSGAVLSAPAAFDTYASAAASAALVAALQAVAANDIVLLAVRDAAFHSTEFTAAAVAAVTAMGGAGVAAAKAAGHRTSYALIARASGGGNGAALDEQWKAPSSGSVTATATLAGGAAVEVKSAGMDDGNFASFAVEDGATERILTLSATPVGWTAGKHVAIASTEFDGNQAEKKTIVACAECAPNQIKVAGAFSYVHYGHVYREATPFAVDMRAEVVLLDRSIRFDAELAGACQGGGEHCAHFAFDNDGVHIKILPGFAAARIAYVEIQHGGQMASLGNYPIHYHMCGDVASGSAYVRGNAIHESFARAVTVHATHNLLVEDNVAYDVRGHAYFLEDGIEHGNLLRNNVIVRQRFGWLLPSDRSVAVCEAAVSQDFNGGQTNGAQECDGVSCFWITNPNNTLEGNRCAGSEGFGFWWIFPDRPMGPSYPGNEAFDVMKLPLLGVQRDNVAHSVRHNGVFKDDTIQRVAPSSSTPTQQFSIVHGGRHKPLTGHTSGEPALSEFDGLTVYKARGRAIWMRGGYIELRNVRVSDCFRGLTLASEGTFPNVPGSYQRCVDCRFVGESDNVGVASGGVTYSNKLRRPIPEYTDTAPLRGFEVYDGAVQCLRCAFADFKLRNESGVQRQAAAIGWLLNDNWQLTPRNNVSGAQFADVDVRVEKGDPSAPGGNWFGALDGDLNAVVTDVDSSVTEYSSVLTQTLVRAENQYFTTFDCAALGYGKLQRCPSHFGFLYARMQQMGAENFACNGGGGNCRQAFFVRDERSSAVHTLQRPDPNNFFKVAQWQSLVIKNRSMTLHFSHPTPKYMRYSMSNFDQGDWLRLGVCYPTQLDTLTVRRHVGGAYGQGTTTALTAGASLAAVDAAADGSVYWHDAATTGMLFVKLVAQQPRLDDDYHNAQGFESIEVVTSGGGAGTASGDCRSTAYPLFAVQEKDCAGVPSGSARLDNCGVCDGPGGCVWEPPTSQPTAAPTAAPTPTSTDDGGGADDDDDGEGVLGGPAVLGELDAAAVAAIGAALCLVLVACGVGAFLLMRRRRRRRFDAGWMASGAAGGGQGSAAASHRNSSHFASRRASNRVGASSRHSSHRSSQTFGGGSGTVGGVAPFPPYTRMTEHEFVR